MYYMYLCRKIHTMKIGKITEHTLVDVFKHEASGFTPWLEKNLDLLSQAVGFQMTRPETEMQLDNFRVDIVACAGDNNTDRIVIENQFGASNHDHLGKLLAYISTVEAKAAIWICEEARIEHINAIRMLNELSNHSKKCGFFLVVANALSIDGSNAAVSFTTIVKPDFDIIRKDISDTQYLLLDFWKHFLEKAKYYNLKPYANRSATRDHWMNGKSVRAKGYLCVSVSRDSFTVKFIFDCKDGKAINEDNYRIYEEHKDEIETIYGEPLDWRLMPDNKVSMICKTYEGEGYAATDEWDAVVNNMSLHLIALNKAVEKFSCLL